MEPTRYQRVKDILDSAAGSSTAERFWDVPLADLKEASLHGVRLIAVEGTNRTCCGTPTTRGEASGLVQGLRGEAPFDGSRFPRLPWGGTPVAEDDIRFISDWIDDGLPAEDREIAAFEVEVKTASTSLEALRADNLENAITHSALVGAEEYAYENGEIKQRMNLDCLSETQIEKLRFAFREMYALNKWPEDIRSYNNMALIHQNHCQHGWERFLPWHRIYLYEFEQALQDQCPDVTLPYWDWTMAQYVPEHPELGWIIPMSFQAFLTDASMVYLRNATPGLTARQVKILTENMVGKRYASQQRFFREVRDLIGPKYTEGEHRHRFIDALLASNSLWYPLRYPAEYHTPDGKPGTLNKVIHYHYPKPEDIAEILSLRTFRDFGGGSIYNDSFGFIDQNPHNTMHLWTGGMNPDPEAGKAEELEEGDPGQKRNKTVLVAGRRFHTRDDMYSQPAFGDMFSNLTASYDPVFWPIHSNVDRLWWEWEQMHPQSVPADLDSVLTPWSYTIADTLDISRFGYEYVKSTCVLPVGLETPVGRFVSKPIDVPKTVRAGFRQAEVRLHRVPQLPRSCFIRVFLNLPDANADTSIEDPHYAGYLAVFGHGPCIGGPGHCEVPVRRKYDLRPRSHNTPRNHRINVTKTARRLLDEGAKSLQITLVVIGVDYREENELLRLQGVSLNFLD
ncbi:MAG TPA: tyrosinase family protein [Thermoanaerobaculia bacterium]|jgi:tyrosinase|nr:tyrosinase family protein [Thermoanaerobaculia bacterium]